MISEEIIAQWCIEYVIPDLIKVVNEIWYKIYDFLKEVLVEIQKASFKFAEYITNLVVKRLSKLKYKRLSFSNVKVNKKIIRNIYYFKTQHKTIYERRLKRDDKQRKRQILK